MDIVMLAAGTSSRMGNINKMLLPYKNTSLVCFCCLQALRFLQKYSEQTDESCTLIIVTGYRRPSVEKALKDCKSFIGETNSKLKMIVVNNPNYRNGQFTSTKVGVSQVADKSPFFISLADMPLILAENYEILTPLLSDNDAVRPFTVVNGERHPGHPVLHAYKLKEKILSMPDDYSVSKILKSCKVIEPEFQDISWSKDIDVETDYKLM